MWFPQSYDSFRFLNKKVYLFQITVSNEHDIKVDGLMQFKQCFCKNNIIKKNSKDFPEINIIFIVPRNDLKFQGLQLVDKTYFSFTFTHCIMMSIN